ncbi:MAG TPA: caspase family protein [Tepidisphaeraceae bacterium]|jgi:uncharacterized caspase-like protein
MKKLALLVGVDNYQDKSISPLRFAGADVKALADRLLNRCGFDQARVLSGARGANAPTLGNLLDALGDAASEVRAEDLFLFCFSGHGVEVGEQSYLLTQDSRQARPELLSLAVSMMSEVMAKDIAALAKAPARGTGVSASLSACGPGQRAYEWHNKGHGAFTHYLLEGLDDAAWDGELLTFRRLADHTIKEVARWSESTHGISDLQVPWYEVSGGADDIVLGSRGTRTAAPPSHEAAASDAPAHEEQAARKTAGGTRFAPARQRSRAIERAGAVGARRGRCATTCPSRIPKARTPRSRPHQTARSGEDGAAGSRAPRTRRRNRPPIAYAEAATPSPSSAERIFEASRAHIAGASATATNAAASATSNAARDPQYHVSTNYPAGGCYTGARLFLPRRSLSSVDAFGMDSATEVEVHDYLAGRFWWPCHFRSLDGGYWITLMAMRRQGPGVIRRHDLNNTMSMRRELVRAWDWK